MESPSISPQTNAEISAATAEVWQQIHDYCSALEEEKFFAKPAPEVWSVAENLEHLFIGTKAVVKALGVPKIALRSFGKPNREGRSYQEVVQRYQERLAALEGPVRQGDYAPKVDPQMGVASFLEKWESIGQKYRERIESWSEDDLDKYLLPHPLLGKMLVREMLFFTVYHSYHHLKIMHDRIDG